MAPTRSLMGQKPIQGHTLHWIVVPLHFLRSSPSFPDLGILKVQLLICIAAASAKSLQSCLTLCNPTDSSPPGALVPGILQARALEWVAISFSNA